MVVKVYVSGISGNKEVKKRQQRVLMILDSKQIKYEVIDIAEPGREDAKEFMQNNAKSNGGTVSDPNPRSPLPPQVFNDDEYCGDYDQFDLANEVDTLEQFVKVEAPPEIIPEEENKENILNGDAKRSKSKESSQERDADGDKAVSKEGTPAKEGTSREGTPAKGSKTASKEPSPAKDDEEAASGKESKEASPEKEGSSAKEKSPEKEGSVDKEKSPEKEASPEKEPSPAKEKSTSREAPTEKASSPEKESDVESKKSSKENTPEKDELVNENGKASSREQSQDKEGAGDSEADAKKDPSSALIESEQAVSED